MTGWRAGFVLLCFSVWALEPAADGWAYSKVLWMGKPEVSGSILIRGRQIDGTNAIGFGMGEDPEFALQWNVASQSGWTNLPSEIRVRAPCCYAYQVDSQNGSEVIVFLVTGIP